MVYRCAFEWFRVLTWLYYVGTTAALQAIMNATNRKAETMTDTTLQVEENRFSRQRFGGGEAGERAAYEALSAHEAQLVDGTRVRVYRGQPNGLIGTVDGQTSGHSVYVLAPDGLRWIVETRNLELLRKAVHS